MRERAERGETHKDDASVGEFQEREPVRRCFVEGRRDAVGRGPALGSEEVEELGVWDWGVLKGAGVKGRLLGFGSRSGWN